MYRHQDDVTMYPIALNGLGKNEGPPRGTPTPGAVSEITPAPPAMPKTSPEVSRLSSRTEDLYSFGAISASARARISMLLSGGNLIDAEAIITDAERKFQSKKTPFNFVLQVDKFLPEGYKIKQTLIRGVPNYVLYSGVWVGGLFLLKSLKKRK